MKNNWKYCPYCGDKLEHKIVTDINSEKICKTSRLICNRPSYKILRDLDGKTMPVKFKITKFNPKITL